MTFCSQRLFLSLFLALLRSLFVCFIFKMTLLNKNSTRFRNFINIIDNNEISNNATIQTKCMHKTNDNRKKQQKQTLVPQVIETR